MNQAIGHPTLTIPYRPYQLNTPLCGAGGSITTCTNPSRTARRQGSNLDLLRYPYSSLIGIDSLDLRHLDLVEHLTEHIPQPYSGLLLHDPQACCWL